MKAEISHNSSPTNPPSLGPVLLCLWLAILPKAGWTEDRVFSLRDTGLLPGVTFESEVQLSDLQGFAGADFVIAYDPAVVTLLDVNRTAATEDFLLVHGAPALGRVSISMAAGEGLVSSGAGTIATLSIQLVSGVGEGTLSVLSARTAKWYDENSVRHTLLGDNGQVAVGQPSPGNLPLTLGLGTAQGAPGSEVLLPMVLSLGHSMGTLNGTLVFNPEQLAFTGWQPGPALAGYTSVALEEPPGSVRLELSGTTESIAASALDLGEFGFSVASGATPGSELTVSLVGTGVANLEGLSYSHLPVNGSILVEEGAVPTETPSPTATDPPTATASPSLTASATAIHSPSETPEPTQTPTSSTSTEVNNLADFNGDKAVDQADLTLFLQIWRQEVTRP